MIHFSESQVPPVAAESSADGDGGYFIDLDRLLAAVRRQIWVIIAGGIVGLVLGLAYLITAVPLYTASTNILIDRSRSKVVTELTGPATTANQDADMDSQVELLKSKEMAKAVVVALKLNENDDFLAGAPSVLGSAVGSVRSVVSSLSDFLFPAQILDDSDENVADAKFGAAVGTLMRDIVVSRVGTTYVLSVSYTSAIPYLAANIANAYGEAYLDDQLQAKFDATKRASVWLQDRIAELKQQSFEADLKVQQFRRDNGLITAGGQLVSEQQLSEINTQLVTAQAATAESKAQFDQIENLIKSGRTDAVVNDALASSTINSLRGKYLDVSKRESEIRAKLGPTHVQVIRLQAEVRKYEAQIFEEMRRIAESYLSTYKVAASREESLRNSLAEIVGVNANENTSQVKLRELEREADTFRSLYDNFLQRYQETVQQQSFPITEARVITQAAEPARPSSPKKPLILALFAVLGVAAATCVGGFREYRDRFFRIGNQIRRELNVEFLGYMPIVSNGPLRDEQISAAKMEAGGDIWRPESMATHVRFHPMSPFAETLRNIKVAADMGMPELSSKVIGVVSCLPSEGKSTISANLGILLAMQGAKVLLVDGDMRNPGLTRSLQSIPENGLIETIVGASEFEETLRWDSSGRLAVLPTVLKRRVSHTAELLASPSMAKMLDSNKSKFDYVIVDLPPIGPVVDAKAFAHRVDAFVFVVEWGETSRYIVRSMLSHNPAIAAKTLGVVLNKSDASKMKLYRSYGAVEYYSSQYKGYYHS
ncbi:chromosome partitioning protein ParA [Aureimonas sp. SA4125]|uniref:polysaccharide biosynthesis tyrosine autokinase n=1 Tax=Aureimonas sp. SA4125 TaxID=2826993 RepID=UPI001CC55AED|nr:polysaccharide biosynthesis tyrosine autokinase [Aureimonas sp. SA4125]BDA83372.1 chromosome partitioning protein ParA [Aureimonas sp. SA4125]